jgi:hypothetical protein
MSRLRELILLLGGGPLKRPLAQRFRPCSMRHRRGHAIGFNRRKREQACKPNKIAEVENT